jgi:putative serine protease PepD
MDSVARALPSAHLRLSLRHGEIRLTRPDAGIRLDLDGRDMFFGQDVTIRIGRDPGVDVQSTNPSVDGQHATISYFEGRWVIEDHSHSGTYREGAAIDRLEIDEPITLRLGDPENGAVLTLTPVAGEAAFQRTTRRIVIGAAAVVLLVAGIAAAVVVLATRDDSNGGGSSALEGRGLARLKAATVLLAGDPSDPGKTGWGSGTMVDKSGLILTNAHVAAITNPPAPGLGAQYEAPPDKGPTESGPIYVYTTNGTDDPAQPAYIAEQVAVDGYLDLAVFKITEDIDGAPLGDLDLPYVPLGNSAALTAGQQLTIFGFPGNAGTTAVSVDPGAVRSFVGDKRIGERRAWINFSANIAHGNSGGLAVDDDGKIVGIPTRFGNETGGFGDLPARRLRPINLALPLIDAARNGDDYDEYQHVKRLSGDETIDWVGWAPSDSDGCTDRTVTGYRSGSSGVFPQFRYAGMTADVDALIYLVGPDPDTGKRALLDKEAVQWGAGKKGCVVLSFTPRGSESWADGDYTVAMLLGPNFEVDAGAEATSVGGS